MEPQTLAVQANQPLGLRIVGLRYDDHRLRRAIDKPEADAIPGLVGGPQHAAGPLRLAVGRQGIEFPKSPFCRCRHFPPSQNFNFRVQEHRRHVTPARYGVHLNAGADRKNFRHAVNVNVDCPGVILNKQQAPFHVGIGDHGLQAHRVALLRLLLVKLENLLNGLQRRGQSEGFVRRCGRGERCEQHHHLAKRHHPPLNRVLRGSHQFTLAAASAASIVLTRSPAARDWPS